MLLKHPRCLINLRKDAVKNKGLLSIPEVKIDSCQLNLRFLKLNVTQSFVGYLYPVIHLSNYKQKVS